ncbi:hypothetical protein NOR_03917 [Metarhizium rileyi]|uniref:Uncharacterized protein n=1 Tax=Metarhizium rileyi (strain RCEF 4871) TaxID=1649241 RepID=A0A167EN66_METRR|nr:hypothetical protein NOR_03917 [Metarhizium rileyi RCEF 4871]
MSSSFSVSEQQYGPDVQNRKRPNTYDTAQDSFPTKRIQSAVRIASNFPPKFWDNLSKVWLTPRALREKDRRNGAQPPGTVSAASVIPTTLARFARRGGPDLRHLRGYPEPKKAARMSSSSTPLSRRTQSTKATIISSKAKRSSAYNKDFEQNLIDHGIYPEGFEHTDGRLTPEPDNSEDIIRDLANTRASLSPSQFSISAFKKFKLANSRVISKGKVIADILPIIRGSSDIPNDGNLPFANLDSITDGTTVDAVPDLYDGSHPKELDKIVRQGLSKTVIPTNHRRAPIAPNFFMEAKAPRGGADVAKRQACLDGAVGARAMHGLQNYGENQPVYDGNSRTFSSTYHAGTGTLHLHSLQEQLRSEMLGTLLGDNERRSSRKLMLERRKHGKITVGEHSNEVHDDGHPYGHGYESEVAAWQYSHDDLQQHIAETYAEAYEDNSEGPTTPQQYTADESQDPGQGLAASGADDAAISFVSSFTSYFNADTTRPKRTRQSFSSPTQGNRLSKSRSRATAVQRPVESPTTGEPERSPRDPAENVISWVEKEWEGFIALRRHTYLYDEYEE